MKDQASKLRQLVTGLKPVASHTKSKETQQTRVIAVTSGKGGVGKTTLAVNLALILAEKPSKVLLADADLGLANVDVMLGLKSGRHIGHLLLTSCQPAEVASDGPKGIKVISGGSGIQELADANEDDRRRLLEKLEKYFKEFDYVIIDTSPGIGSDVLDFIRISDDILLTTTPEPTSLKDTYAAYKSIRQKMPDQEIQLVVNNASKKQAENAIQTLNQVIHKFLDEQCQNWHRIDNDALVGRSVREHKPIILSYPRTSAALSLRRIAKNFDVKATALAKAA